MKITITITLEVEDNEAAIKVIEEILRASSSSSSGSPKKHVTLNTGSPGMSLVGTHNQELLGREKGLESEEEESDTIATGKKSAEYKEVSSEMEEEPIETSNETEEGGDGEGRVETDIGSVVDDLLKKVVSNTIEEEYPSKKKQSDAPKLVRDVVGEEFEKEATSGEEEEVTGEAQSSGILEDALLEAFAPSPEEEDEEILRKKLEEIKRRKIVG